ncbi:MAG: DNA recombination protein RmuC [Nitrospiraceae bacterium]|nr:DNA recombination protein RmuC [Nitrospiraceae bacterium]
MLKSPMITALLVLIIALLAAVIFLIYKSRPVQKDGAVENRLAYMEKGIKDDLARNMDASAKQAREAREELGNSFKGLGDSIFRQMSETAQLLNRQLESFSGRLSDLTRSNAEQLERMTTRQGELIQAVEQKMEKAREAVEAGLKAIQADTNLKLEKMRETVDEKLQTTLERRLGESFKIVSERLEQVHKGLGEMQNLANDVGDLKKVLSNVKTRGIHGEIQLGSILEQLLAPGQYETNVATKKGSRDNVEFAIKLPGTGNPGISSGGNGAVYLPVDSKFPLDKYEALVKAYEHGEAEKIEEAGRDLETAIKKCAKDIREKYIDPPGTTDFGIMFLPIEGLYAEVVRRTGLFETLHREYKISITGPTTLSAFLNSLQMGFRTLAIEKRSSEVWEVLGTVKNEFEKFGDVLMKTQTNLSRTSDELEKLVGVRTRQIQRALKTVQQLPDDTSKAGLLDEEAS